MKKASGLFVSNTESIDSKYDLQLSCYCHSLAHMARMRIYIFETQRQRDIVVEEFFKICYYVDTIEWPLEYQVTKLTRSNALSLGRPTTRTYKVTMDSLIILDSSNSIKKELPLVGIKHIDVSKEVEGLVRIQFKDGLGSQARAKEIICRNSRIVSFHFPCLSHG